MFDTNGTDRSKTMSETYSIRISRNEGVVEISGADKEWVAALVEKLTPVFSGPAPADAGKRSTGHEDLSDVLETAARTRTRNRRGGTTRAKVNPALEAKLTPELKEKLQAWREAREGNWKQQQRQMAIVATFLRDELGWKRVDEDDIYTVYSTMGWPSPGNPKAALENARARAGHFGPWSNGKIELSHTGENFGRSVPAASAAS
jgi:hypothetical protein